MLASGGRTMDNSTPTAPNVERLRVKPGSRGPVETSRTAVPDSADALLAAGYRSQLCYPGMGEVKA